MDDSESRFPLTCMKNRPQCRVLICFDACLTFSFFTPPPPPLSHLPSPPFCSCSRCGKTSTYSTSSWWMAASCCSWTSVPPSSRSCTSSDVFTARGPTAGCGARPGRRCTRGARLPCTHWLRAAAPGRAPGRSCVLESCALQCTQWTLHALGGGRQVEPGQHSVHCCFLQGAV